MDPEERAALEHLSKVEGRPMNQLLNEAIKSYLSRKGRKERSLEANLAALRAYRKQDPGFSAPSLRSWKPKPPLRISLKASRSAGSSSTGSSSRQGPCKARSETF
jgi:hypothetical protein